MSRGLLEEFHGRAPRAGSRAIRWPAGLLEVGSLAVVGYWPPKGTRFGRSELVHRFERPVPLYVGVGGVGLWVPDARFTARGFEG